jgi:Fur family ferric uptake transcriptional regulator
MDADGSHLRDRERTLARFLAERGLKATRQRNAIVETFLAVEGHISVEELLAKVREEDPRISQATVYRTMRLLTEAGLAHSRQFGEGQSRFEPAAGREHHDHLICTACGAIVEFENERIERLQHEEARRHGFSISHHKMELYGLCRACQAGGEKDRR